jgi:hypothetical protein
VANKPESVLATGRTPAYAAMTSRLTSVAHTAAYHGPQGWRFFDGNRQATAHRHVLHVGSNGRGRSTITPQLATAV